MSFVTFAARCAATAPMSVRAKGTGRKTPSRFHASAAPMLTGIAITGTTLARVTAAKRSNRSLSVLPG